MPNRVIKDSVWDSPTLGGIPDYYEDQFIRWALLSDDWGCFNANAVKIKGDVYPNREICDMKSTFNQCTSVQNFSAIRCPANLWPFSFQCPNPIP